MPLNNLSKPSATHQRNPSSDVSISSIPEDQMKALVSNIANATIAALPQNLSTVEKNLQDLQKRLSSMNKQISFRVNNQELGLRIKDPDVSSDLPILFMKDITDTIDLSLYLPVMLQQQGCATILDLLKKEFPKLTSSFFDKKAPRFVFSSPIPLNHEDKGNFFPQIESEGQIAYIAWDSSGRLAKGFKEKTCDVLLENKEAFCGASLSQANLEGIEKGAGVAAHFMTSKVTVIGILITKPPISKQEWWWGGRTACDSAAGFNDLCCADSSDLARGSLVSGRTTFGMLGVQGASVSSAKEDLPDRLKRDGEKLIPFCLEIVPQFSSEENPVKQDDLEMAIEMQFQEKVFAKFR